MFWSFFGPLVQTFFFTSEPETAEATIADGTETRLITTETPSDEANGTKKRKNRWQWVEGDFPEEREHPTLRGVNGMRGVDQAKLAVYRSRVKLLNRYLFVLHGVFCLWRAFSFLLLITSLIVCFG